jgi:hypothetical protein
VAVHAQALNLVDDLGVIVAVLLRARLGDFAPHVLEEVLCEASLLCHFGNVVQGVFEGKVAVKKLQAKSLVV